MVRIIRGFYLTKGRHVKNNVDKASFLEALLLRQETTLYGSAIRDRLVRVDAMIRLFTVVEVLEQFPYLGLAFVCVISKTWTERASSDRARKQRART